MNVRDERNNENKRVEVQASVGDGMRKCPTDRRSMSEEGHREKEQREGVSISPDYPLSLQRDGEKCRSIGWKKRFTH